MCIRDSLNLCKSSFVNDELLCVQNVVNVDQVGEGHQNTRDVGRALDNDFVVFYKSSNGASVFLSINRATNERRLHYEKAVSYTHLDVYKRQLVRYSAVSSR